MADIGWYNGWSPKERHAVTPLQYDAIRSGALRRPTICSICGCTGGRNWRALDAVWFHNERYDLPLEVYHICCACHRTLHQRFDAPHPWLMLIERYGRNGSGFELLSLDPQSQFRPFEDTYPAGLPWRATVAINSADVAPAE